MNFDLARTYLGRVSRLFDDLSEGGGNASTLEQDLLREYVRRLYEALTDEASAAIKPSSIEAAASVAPPAKQPAAHKQPVPPAAPSGPELMFTTRSRQVAEESAPEPAPVSQPAPVFAFEPSPDAVARRDVAPPPPPRPASAPPRMIHVPDSVEEDVNRIEANRNATQPYREAVSHPDVTHTPPRAAAPESPFEPEVDELPRSIRALFLEDMGGSDLSARLSSSPVRDLSRAFAIGERMLMQKELFGNDATEMNAALSHLNGLPDYESATAYLGGGVAKKHHWAEGERAEVARDFAKVVRRRYS